MKMLIISLVVMILCGCAGSGHILMSPDKTYVVENEGKALFSLRVPDSGAWYLVAPDTMKSGFININGSPDNSYVGYSLRFRFITNNDHPDFLSSVIPVLKTGDYEQFLQDSLDWYTPERLIEQKKTKPGGKIIDVQGLRCKNYWSSEHIGANINSRKYGGQGITVYSSFIVCPLVIDGVITQLNISIRSSIKDQLYLEKEEYDRTKKPEDPEFIIDPVAIMKELGDNVVEIFNTLKIYGSISQSYEDVKIKCHPTLGDEC